MTALAPLLASLLGASPLDLGQVLSLARDSAPEVRRSREAREVQAAQTALARGALGPVLSATSDLSALGPGTESNPATKLDGDAQWRNTLLLKWTLWDGLEGWNTLRGARARLRAAEASLEAVREAAAASAAVAWADLVREEERTAARTSTLAVSREREATALRREALGGLAGLEARQARLDRIRDSLALLRERDARDAAARALALALGRDPGAEVAGTALPEADRYGEASDEVRESPELRSARALEAAAAADARARSAAWWPELSVSAQWSLLDRIDYRDESRQAWDHGTLLGAQASWTLFEGGQTLARRRSALATREQAALAARERERADQADLEAARARRATAKRGAQLQQEAEVQAEAVLQAALAQYEAGAISGLDLRGYQDSRLQARLDRIEALHELLAADLAMRRVAGLPVQSP